MQVYNYKSIFNEAYERSLEFKLNPPKIRYSNDTFLGDFLLMKSTIYWKDGLVMWISINRGTIAWGFI